MLTLTPVLLLASLTRAANIVLSNDDGWAEINIRAFYNDLTQAGDSVVLSAPAENRSGTGSVDLPAIPLLEPCEFNSCPTGSPAEGFNASDPRLNYVNSFPVTSIKYGIKTLAPKFFGSAPVDLVVAGPNVGANSGISVIGSGTVGAATEAAKEGIPAIAFSGTTGSQTAWNTAPETYTLVYAAASTNLTQFVLGTGKPYLPSNIWLNVNFPAVSDSSCNDADDFKFVLSRIFSAYPGEAQDVKQCGSTRLPTESTVLGTGGCYASVSVAHADTKLDASAEEQGEVLAKLGKLLSCLPS